MNTIRELLPATMVVLLLFLVGWIAKSVRGEASRIEGERDESTAECFEKGLVRSSRVKKATALQQTAGS